MENLLDSYPQGGSKTGMTSDYAGRKHRLHQGGKNEKLEESSSDENNQNQVEEGRGDILTFFSSRGTILRGTWIVFSCSSLIIVNLLIFLKL